MERRTWSCTKEIHCTLGVELISYWNTFVGLYYIFCAQKCRPAKLKVHIGPLIYSAESRVGFSRNRKGYTTRSQTTHVYKISALKNFLGGSSGVHGNQKLDFLSITRFEQRSFELD